MCDSNGSELQEHVRQIRVLGQIKTEISVEGFNQGTKFSIITPVLFFIAIANKVLIVWLIYLPDVIRFPKHEGRKKISEQIERDIY